MKGRVIILVQVKFKAKRKTEIHNLVLISLKIEKRVRKNKKVKPDCSAKTRFCNKLYLSPFKCLSHTSLKTKIKR